MQFISCRQNDLGSQVAKELFGYRYRVFVEQLQWELECIRGFEMDEFDSQNAHHVVVKSDKDRVIGCARLLPTTEPYLLSEVFPELLNGIEAPRDPAIWELSRFTSSDPNSDEGIECQASKERKQFSTDTTSALIFEAMRYAQNQGAKQLISVSPLGIERLLRSLNIPSSRLGPPVKRDGYWLIACCIDLNDALVEP